MPPKKNVVEEKPALIGRLGTNLKVGILGLPNVGKSTFFNVLTKSEAQAENFPFCTIDPNESRVRSSGKFQRNPLILSLSNRAKSFDFRCNTRGKLIFAKFYSFHWIFGLFI